MMKFVGVVLCLLAMQPWEAAAHPRRMKGSSQKDEVEIDEGFGTEEIPPVEDDRIEVIIGLNVQDEESTFTAMSNTIDLLSDSVTLEELIPEISSGVARIPIEVSACSCCKRAIQLPQLETHQPRNDIHR
jgi:hypothetical protein